MENPEANLQFKEYCEYFSYPVETHEIITEDGYILTYFRIQSKFTEIKQGLPVVFLQHGLLAGSDEWIMNQEDLAPGFILAQEGYDVWLGNSRGTHHSLKHSTYDASQSEYWQFSWQHMAEFDLPAAFEYITKTTQQSKINYIGHSQGTTQMFAALSEQNKAILEKLNSFIALGPIAFGINIKSNSLKVLSKLKILKILDTIKHQQLFGQKYLKLQKFSLSLIQKLKLDKLLYKISKPIHAALISFVAGFDKNIDNYMRYNVLLQHDPNSTSMQNILHWDQMMNSNKFQKFNKNSSSQEEYNLSNIKIEMALFAAKNDELANSKDISKLKNELINVSSLKYYEIEGGHQSFFWSKDMTYFEKVLVYLKEKNQ